MKTFVNIFLGFFIFESVGAVPITDTVTYDSEFYDVSLGELPHPFVSAENDQSDQVEVMRTFHFSILLKYVTATATDGFCWP